MLFFKTMHVCIHECMGIGVDKQEEEMKLSSGPKLR